MDINTLQSLSRVIPLFLLIFIARGNLYFLAKLLSFSHCQRHRLNGNSVISEDVLLIHSVRINFQRRGDAVPTENKTKLKARREGENSLIPSRLDALGVIISREEVSLFDN